MLSLEHARQFAEVLDASNLANPNEINDVVALLNAKFPHLAWDTDDEGNWTVAVR